MKRILVRTTLSAVLTLLIAGVVPANLHADDHLGEVLGSGATHAVEQQEPHENDGKLKVTVIRSLVSETIKLLVTYPKDANPISIRMHNLLGRQILQLSESSAIRGESTYQIDTSDLPNGHYFIVIEALGQRITKKVVLSR